MTGDNMQVINMSFSQTKISIQTMQHLKLYLSFLIKYKFIMLGDNLHRTVFYDVRVCNK